MEERLQKILARAGHGARRKCEEIILAGRVSVNGAVVSELGSKADASTDDIRVDGKRIFISEKVYVMLNKPAGCVSTAKDTRGRPTVIEYIKDAPGNVFHVGRLDFDTEGLLLFTNDGEFCQKITHPKHKIEKVYEAVVERVPGEKALEALRRGVMLRDGPTAPARVELVSTGRDRVKRRKKPGRPPEEVNSAVVRVTIHEGRKRQVRRMLKEVGHPVIKLKRLKIGALELGSLPVGRWRRLSPEEAALALGEQPGDG